MRRWITVMAVWAAAATLFATISAQAKPGGIITPDVVGMTVAEAVEAWAQAGFLLVPSVQPGDLDPATVPDEVVLGQDPEPGSRQFADYPGVLYLEEVEPSPTPSPTASPSPAPAPDDADDAAPAPGAAGAYSGSLSFTL
ncbi:MAG TPA: PASTA domain-containing protein [Thermoleophilia bacterium]|nr:PASTA domain-containing protein [Thermoleophilia bacterium]